MFSNKGQTAIEYLLIVVGVLLLAIIVIYIIVTTGSSSQNSATDSENKLNNITDSAIFPPKIQSSTCDYNGVDKVHFILRIFESPTSGINTYCLYLSNKDANACSIYSGGQLLFDYNVSSGLVPIDNNTFDITLVSRFDENHISNQSVSERCTISN